MRTLLTMCLLMMVGCSNMYPCQTRNTYVVEGPERSIPQMRCADFVFVESYQEVYSDNSSEMHNSDARVYRVDKYGNVQYHKPGWKIQGDKIYQTDRYGNTQYHKSSRIITD